MIRPDDWTPVTPIDWNGLVAEYRPYERRFMVDLAESGSPTAREECAVIHALKGLLDARLLHPVEVGAS